MIYFTADTHFCHSNIIGSCGRSFEKVGEMNRTLIENRNSYVTARDEVYILGDFLYKGTVIETVDGKVLERICATLQCQPGEVIEYIPDHIERF